MQRSMLHAVAVVFLFSFLMNSTGFAETEDHSLGQTGQGQSASSSGRPQADDQAFLNRALDFLVPKFLIARSTLENQFGSKLPQAVTKAMNGDETEVTPIVAYLMGRVNDAQVKGCANATGELAETCKKVNITEPILKSISDEKKKEEALKPEKGDDRWIAFLDRLAWGGKKKINDPSKEEGAQKYNQEFDKANEQVKKDNAEIIEKMKQASQGIASAKEWLFKKLDPKSILAFAEGQIRSGNEKLGTLALDAIALLKDKNKFLDMSIGNVTQRIHMGTSADSVSKAAQGAIDNLGGFKGALASFSPFTQAPNQQFHVGSDGKWTSGAPANVVIDSPQVKPPQQPPGNNPPPQQPPGNNPPPQNPPQQNPGPKKPDVGALQAVLSQGKCTGCHNPPKVASAEGVVIGPGKVKPWSQIITRFETNPPPGMGSDAVDIKALVRKLKELTQ